MDDPDLAHQAGLPYIEDRWRRAAALIVEATDAIKDITPELVTLLDEMDESRINDALEHLVKSNRALHRAGPGVLGEDYADYINEFTRRRDA